MSNGATRGQFPDFNLLKAFGLEELKRKLWTLKNKDKDFIFLTLLNFLLEMKLNQLRC